MISLQTFKDFRVVGKWNDELEIKYKGKKYSAAIEGEASWMPDLDVFTVKGKPKLFIAYFEDMWSHQLTIQLEAFEIIGGKLVNITSGTRHYNKFDTSLYLGSGWRKKSPLWKAKKLMSGGYYSGPFTGYKYSYIDDDGEVVVDGFPTHIHGTTQKEFPWARRRELIRLRILTGDPHDDD